MIGNVSSNQANFSSQVVSKINKRKITPLSTLKNLESSVNNYVFMNQATLT
jgi:hypothetical protein